MIRHDPLPAAATTNIATPALTGMARNNCVRSILNTACLPSQPMPLAAIGSKLPGFLSRLRGSPRLRALLRSPVFSNLAMTVVWVLTWELAKLVEYTEHASMWFPAAGLTFAALLLEGARLVPGMFAACVVVTIWVGRHYNLPLTDLQLACGGMLFGLAHIGGGKKHLALQVAIVYGIKVEQAQGAHASSR